MVPKQLHTITKSTMTQFIAGFFVLYLFANLSSNNLSTYHSEGFTIHQITQSFSNVFIVEQYDKVLMIDAGNPEKGDVLASKLMDIGIDPADIDYLILTHAHPDHAGNAQYFKENYGVKLLVGTDEMEIVKAQGKDNHLCPRGPLGLLIQRTHAKATYKSFVPDILIKDSFDLASIGFKGLVHTLPGHTPGSLYIEMNDIIFVGDLIRGQVLNKKKPAYHLFMCDLADNLKNIRMLADKAHIKWWYPGHGGPLSAQKIKEFIRSN